VKPKMIVCFLQNAWSPLYAGGTWPRRSWLKALAKSRSGQRLRVFEGAAACAIHYDNTTPIVGDNPNSVVAPDEAHIRGVLREVKPDCVVTFGRQAAEVVTEIAHRLPVLQLPHPAHRLVTNSLYEQAGSMVREGFWGIVSLRQGRGEIIEARQ